MPSDLSDASEMSDPVRFTGATPSAPGARGRFFFIFITNILRAAGQGISFFLIARGLGSNDFGKVVASLAILGPIGPFVDLGSYSILSRDIALGGNPLHLISENTRLLGFTITIGLLVGAIICILLHIDVGLIVFLLIGLGYYLISRTSLMLSSLQTASEHFKGIVWLEITSVVVQILIALYIFKFHSSLFQWAQLYSLAGILNILLANLFIRRNFGKIIYIGKVQFSRIREGMIFSVGTSSQFIYTDIDKIYTSKFSSLSITGNYGLAARFITLALIPIGAFNTFMYPRLITAAQKGMHILWRQVGLSIVVCAGYALIASIILYIASSYIKVFMGQSYSIAGYYLVGLIVSFCLQVVQNPFADLLTSIRAQKARSSIQLLVAVTSIITTYIFISKNNYYGMIYANAFINIILFLLMVICAIALSRRYEQ